MTQNQLTRNERFLKHVRTWPFWAFLTTAAVMIAVGLWVASFQGVTKEAAFLGGIGVTVVMDFFRGPLMDMADENAGISQT